MLAERSILEDIIQKAQQASISAYIHIWGVCHAVSVI